MSIYLRRQLVAMFVIACLYLSASSSVATEKPVSCTSALENANTLSATELWRGTGDCASSDQQLEANYLLIIGQIRAVTDMSLLEPATDEDTRKVGELYRTLFFKSGGTGFVEIYRDANYFDHLIHKIKQWQVSPGNEYNPGWNYKPTLETKLYNQMIHCRKSLRIVQLNNYASLIQTDKYYQLKTQLDQLRSDNPGALKKGTEVYQQYQSLNKAIAAISDNVQTPDDKPQDCSAIKPYTPDPDANFKQLFKGYNGPEKSAVKVFYSEQQVRDSWVVEALSAGELKIVLSQVDFNDQVLVAMSFGQKKTATGVIDILKIEFNAKQKKSSISGRIGVNETDCLKPWSSAYPFAIAVAERPAFVSKYPGRGYHTFGDGCQEVISGVSIEK